jgi:hypothetical protein
MNYIVKAAKDEIITRMTKRTTNVVTVVAAI